MPSIKNLEMAAAVSANKNISIVKSFFGLSQKVVYTPTQSPVKVVVNDYSSEEGSRLERLLSLSADEIERDLAAKGTPAKADLGPCRLEACVSADGQFCAVQLFHFADFRYTPFFKARFFEGDEAKTIAKLL